jgi:glycine cleavage system H protein
MSAVPENLKYTKEHEWVSDNGDGTITFGITDYAQSALGDIVYIQLPKVGSSISAGAVCGEVESTKSVSEIYAPISGEILEVNDSLNSTPEKINQDPYKDGWIAKVKTVGEYSLLDPAGYRAVISG